jgi:SAM-dependent methyltransferase
MPDLTMFSRAFWDERYRTRDRLWSGRPNVQLIAEAQGLTPGRALDVGCGEGTDAIWLAQQGWTVTGIDLWQGDPTPYPVVWLLIDYGRGRHAVTHLRVPLSAGWG